MYSTRELWDALVDLVVPRVCALCGELDVVVCETCDLRMREPGGAQRTLALPGGSVVVHSALTAGPDILRVITLFKDSGRSDLAPYLGAVLRSICAPRDPVVDVVTRTGSDGRGGVVVTVPQSRRAYRRRGWNPVHTLARAAGFTPVAVLEVQPRHVDQTTLTRDARWHNVAHTVRVAPARADMVRGRNVTIVDDVITTGATVCEVARALMAAGAHRVQGATLASVERLSQKLTGER
jgi:predicted amidophosphoribosyltransferase